MLIDKEEMVEAERRVLRCKNVLHLETLLHLEKGGNNGVLDGGKRLSPQEIFGLFKTCCSLEICSFLSSIQKFRLAPVCVSISFASYATLFVLQLHWRCLEKEKSCRQQRRRLLDKKMLEKSDTVFLRFFFRFFTFTFCFQLGKLCGAKTGLIKTTVNHQSIFCSLISLLCIFTGLK